jgi:hypothetical protein
MIRSGDFCECDAERFCKETQNERLTSQNCSVYPIVLLAAES